MALIHCPECNKEISGSAQVIAIAFHKVDVYLTPTRVINSRVW